MVASLDTVVYIECRTRSLSATVLGWLWTSCHRRHRRIGVTSMGDVAWPNETIRLLGLNVSLCRLPQNDTRLDLAMRVDIRTVGTYLCLGLQPRERLIWRFRIVREIAVYGL